MTEIRQATGPADDFCGTFYAAKMLGLSVGTVQALVEKNELSAWKTQGGHRRISMQSILDYQKRHLKMSTAANDTPWRLKMMVVDDDPVLLSVIQTCLDQWNLPIDCTALTSAMEALIDISSLKPDLLFTDLVMPGVDGFELLRTLRGNMLFSDMIFVAMTGLDDAAIEQRGGLPPRTVLVHKPLDRSWLHGFLTSQVSIRQMRKA
jgi:excisionase family DNA binding protein